MFTIENAQLVLKDKYGNVARIQNLGPDDLVKINNAIADIGKLVDPVSISSKRVLKLQLLL